MKRDRISLKQAVRLHWRARGLIHRESPGLILSLWLKNAMIAGGPYVTVFFSARVIAELSGARDPRRLLVLVLLTLFSGAAVAFLKAVWQRRETRFAYPLWYVVQKILTGKMLELDYAQADDPQTHERLSQVFQSMNISGWGLFRVTDFKSWFSASLFGMAGAAALGFGLFVRQVPEGGKWVFLNHPAAAGGVLLLLFFVSWLSGFCEGKENKMWAKLMEQGKQGNRLFFYFDYFALRHPERAADIRLYRQQDLCWHYGESDMFQAYSSFLHGKGGAMRGLSQLLLALFTGTVYLFVGLKAISGAFGAGEAVQYIGALTGLSAALSSLLKTLDGIIHNTPYLEGVFRYLDIPNEMHQGSLTTEKRSDNQYDIEFRNVSFRYPNTETWALRNCSLKFRVGQKLAVVGPNGSGKTTFIKLLCRLYDPTEGEILLNGIDIRKYDYQDYLNLFSVVFQDFQLLAFPLGQNVAARENYDPERVRKALEQAGFAERLKEMPKGLDTCLYREFDQDGVKISGGEAQKIALARALYKDAPFIVLDEPTAALDPVAEAEVYEHFNAMVGEKTAVYISHRLSSCKFCDEILVFDGGRTVQHGTHSELVKDKQGKYWELWSAQAKYYQ